MTSKKLTPEDDDAEALAEASDGFFLAAEHGRSDVLKALADHALGKLELRRIVDPKTGRSPLHVAVANGKTDAVRVLLTAGFPPDHESFPAAGFSSKAESSDDSDDPERQRENTPYLLAKQLRASDLVFVFHQFAIQQIATNSVHGVRQMLRAGVSADTTDGAAQNTFVHWAVTCSASDVLALLLQRADVQRDKVMDRVNTEGATPLHLACRANDVECTRLLLRFGADRAVVGERGAFRGKTAIELATAPEVMALFAAETAETVALAVAELPLSGKQMQQSTSGVVTELSPLSSESVSVVSKPPSNGTAVETRRPSHSEKDVPSTRLLLQLEEKDLLIAQLRRTIESLVVESQEIRKLGDERVVLDYVRKLREENAVLQRDLDDAEEHIRIQQEQLMQLKTEMRKLVAAPGTTPHRSNELFESDRSGADTTVRAVTDDSAAGFQRRLPSSPLRLDASEPRASPPPPPSSGGSNDAAWGSVLGGLWPFGASDEVQDIDGEVIMTV